VESVGRYIGCTVASVTYPGDDPPNTNKVYGAFWTTLGNQSTFELQSYCTSWQAEQYSITQLCRLLLTEESSTVRISLSNRAYWLGLKKYKVVTKQLKVLLRLLNQVASQHSLYLSYTDCSDFSLRILTELMCSKHQSSLDSSQVTDYAQVGALPVKAKRQLLNEVWDQQASRWLSDDKHRQSHQFIGGVLPSNQDLQWLLALTRSQLYGLVGIVTGHNTLNRHLSIIGIDVTADCQNCSDNVPETSEHFICHCYKYERLRREIFGNDIIEVTMIQNSWPQMLQFIIHSGRFEFLTIDL